jgi:AraC family transcriptional regulator
MAVTSKLSQEGRDAQNPAYRLASHFSGSLVLAFMSQRLDYLARIHRVMDHIDAHLDQPLDLAELAKVAHFSPWHFHRLFLAITGETLAERVRRRRLEVAAAQLTVHPPPKVLSVALDVGFGSAEVFTRAFSAHFGVTPTAWRRGAHRQWALQRQTQLRKIHQVHRKTNQEVEVPSSDDGWAEAFAAASIQGEPMQVDIKTLPTMRLAYMRHIGPYGDPAIGRLWERFGAWCASQGLDQPRPVMYGLSYDSPDLTAPDKCRYDACVAVNVEFRPSGDVGVITLPGGSYARVKFEGTGAEIHASWMQLFKHWLPDSNYQTDERPCVELYGPDFKLDPETGVFNCELCLPVKPAQSGVA